MKRFILSLLFIAACSAATQSQITNTAGTVCQVVFQAADPSLAPLCVDATEIAQAIEALIAQNSKPGAALGADAGAVTSVTGAVTTAYSPTTSEVYGWLLQHGATSIKR